MNKLKDKNLLQGSALLLMLKKDSSALSLDYRLVIHNKENKIEGQKKSSTSKERT